MNSRLTRFPSIDWFRRSTVPNTMDPASSPCARDVERDVQKPGACYLDRRDASQLLIRWPGLVADVAWRASRRFGQLHRDVGGVVAVVGRPRALDRYRVGRRSSRHRSSPDAIAASST